MKAFGNWELDFCYCWDKFNYFKVDFGILNVKSSKIFIIKTERLMPMTMLIVAPKHL